MTGVGENILVVDDNEDNRYTLIRRLRREGYTELAEATNGRDALDMLAARRFDLILLDIAMPEMNGYDVLEHVKTDMALRDIPVIMISAVDELDSVVRCIQLGAEDYLSKPFNATLLKARVRACLEKKRLRDLEASHLKALDAERRRADALLHAVLPSGAVKELKASNAVVPRRYEGVAVLFCDIVDFTPYCDRNPPEQVVSELQALVDRFERIVDGRGMEKIKTIGDAFLATAGLLRDVEEPVLASVSCGLDMIAAAAAVTPHWQLRVGIHQGPVVAGIIGHRQYLFDLWGDTVNTAARLVSKARPGAVVLTSSTWLQVRDRCSAKSHGFVDIKGKGPIELIECRGILERSGPAVEFGNPMPIET
ncbi:adenylate/guanylate cyclase domain-containing protein [Rhodospirillaceae bacterium SYSU D60014]|uniref:adenylate/guanylate cyclase domain-containing protein n=1 Tax=Virgifigura deserti TaxID=2268457 RepID=UPI0013C530A6